MKLQRGLNLGGYLSQCEHTKTQYETFIQEQDIARIAGWGFDHVRIPIDQEVFEKEDGSIRDAGVFYVDRVLQWCDRYGLDVILDLHKAYGYDFNDAGDAGKNCLFTEPAMQQRFVNLWDWLSKRYGKRENTAFELLNEVVEQENAQAWNDLIERAVAAIRKNAPAATIIYGGIQWNSVKTLKLLRAPADENIIFTFHFYEPLLFTHQKAPWVAAMDPDYTVAYPGTMQEYRERSRVLGYQGEVMEHVNAQTMGTEFIRELVGEAVDVAKKYNVRLYCGEFGVIDRAPVADTLRWFTDVDRVFREYAIGCAAWSYKKMDFGLCDAHYDPIRESLISLWN